MRSIAESLEITLLSSLPSNHRVVNPEVTAAANHFDLMTNFPQTLSLSNAAIIFPIGNSIHDLRILFAKLMTVALICTSPMESEINFDTDN